MSIGAAVAGMITAAAGFNEGTIESAQQASMALLLSFALVPLVFVFVSGAARKAGDVTATTPQE